MRTIRWVPHIACGAIAFWIVYAGRHAAQPTNGVELPLAGIVLCVAAGFLLDDEAAQTLCSVPTSLVVRRVIRVGVGIPLVWAIWGVLAWYAGALTASAAVEFAGMLALTLALAGMGAAILDDVRGGLFATPSLFVLLGLSAFVSPPWRPFPIAPSGSTGFDRYGRWSIVLAVSVFAFLLASVDPAVRRPDRRLINDMVGRRKAPAALTSAHVA